MKLLPLIAVTALLCLSACGKSAEAGGAPNAADGPQAIAVPANLAELVTAGDAKKGEELFASKGCKACHNLDATKLVGPGLAGVSKRRSDAWMARMILKPEEMVKTDDEAKKLLAAYMSAMANQNVNAETELPHLIAYLKTK
jgi:cytochrome c2